MIWLVSLAVAAPRLDRIDVVSDDPGRWLAEDVPRTPIAPGVTALRFAGQVTPVVALGQGWQLGASLTAQSLRREWSLEGTWWGTAALSTHYGLPRGAVAGVAVRTGALRAGVSLAGMSNATWENLDWRHWTLAPTASVGWVNRPRAPWMR